MGDLVNLRQARKRRERKREADAAAHNRVAFGMTKAERRTIEAERTKADAFWTPIGSIAPMPTERGPARIVKRSLVVAGHRTSVSLEDAFWRRLQAIAASRRVSLNTLAAEVDAARGEANLSSALRVFVLETAAPDLDPGDVREDCRLADPRPLLRAQ